MAAFSPLRILAELVNIGTLLAFVIVCAAVLMMRRTNPDAERPFRVPARPRSRRSWESLICLLLMFSLPGRELGPADRLARHRPGRSTSATASGIACWPTHNAKITPSLANDPI